jgi:hypothetical protein
MLRNELCRVLGARNEKRWRRSLLQEHDGIHIADASFRKDLQEAFVSMTTEALRLVARKDPRRYQRIKKYLHFIVHLERHPTAVASYRRWPSACLVDFARFHYGASPRVRTLQLAAAFVHEATHGRLLRRGIPTFQPRKVRLRMERICLAEETRFAAAVDPRLREPYQKAVARAYDRISERHISPWQLFVGITRRMLESQKMSNQSGAANGSQPFRSGRNRTSSAAGSRR